MKPVIFTILFTILFTSLGVTKGAYAADVSNALPRLDATLGRLGDDSRTSRYVGAGILTAAGLGFGIWGAADVVARPMLIVGGALFIPGVLMFVIPTRTEREASRYAALPSGTSEEKQRKVAFGESALADLASRAQAGRIWAGAVSIGVGVGYGIYSAVAIGTGSTQFWLTTGILSASGLALLLIRSDEEAAWEHYQSRSPASAGLKADWGIAVGPKGEPGVGLALRF